jgi:hypothetical protein
MRSPEGRRDRRYRNRRLAYDSEPRPSCSSSQGRPGVGGFRRLLEGGIAIFAYQAAQHEL